MSQPTESLMPARSMTWQEIWTLAVTRPDVATFRALMNDPQATPRHAYTWMLVSSVIAFVVQVIMSKVFSINFIQELFSNLSLAGVAVFTPLVGVLTVLVFIAAVSIQQFMAIMLGGKGHFAQLIYLCAAFIVPLNLIQAVLALVPCLTWVVVVYGVGLNVVAIEAVHDFGWTKAMISVFWLVPLGCMFVCILGFLAAVSG